MFSSSRWNVESGGICRDADLRRRCGRAAAELFALGPEILHFRAIFRQPEKGNLGQVLVRDRHLEAVTESAQRVLRHLLGLMGDHLAFTGFAHAVALDRFRQNDRRLALVVHRRGVGGENLFGIVAAACELPDLVVAHVRDELLQFIVLAEEVFANVSAALALEVLVFAVDALLHALQQQPALVLRQQAIPSRAPQHLNDVPARATEHALEFLNDLAVAANGPVEPLKVAIDDEDQIVEIFATGERNRAEQLRLIGFAVSHERPDLAV